MGQELKNDLVGPCVSESYKVPIQVSVNSHRRLKWKMTHSCDCWQHSVPCAARIRAFVPCWLFAGGYLPLAIGFFHTAAHNMPPSFLTASKGECENCSKMCGIILCNVITHMNSCMSCHLYHTQSEVMGPPHTQREGFT